MKTVYEPANSLEGHMLQDVLRQRGIEARLDGAGLQGAVGELPAIGLVRLRVEDEDYAEARAAIDEWEKTPVANPIEAPPARAPRALVGALMGIILGCGGAYAWFRVPTNTSGYDHNGDGILDERWSYSPSGAPVSSEVDRNFDQIMDVRTRFDRRSVPESSESDDDFDGTFESRTRYRNGQAYLTTTDGGGKLSVNLRYLYRHGVLAKIEYVDTDTGAPLRVEDYVPGKLVRADVDTDRDGRLDRRYFYDDLANVTSTEEIAAPQ
jgi:hypothetical protein